MVNLWLPSMATRTMIFGFICSKTMANFRKGTRKLNALLVVKLLPTYNIIICFTGLIVYYAKHIVICCKCIMN